MKNSDEKKEKRTIRLPFSVCLSARSPHPNPHPVPPLVAGFDKLPTKGGRERERDDGRAVNGGGPDGVPMPSVSPLLLSPCALSSPLLGMSKHRLKGRTAASALLL